MSQTQPNYVPGMGPGDAKLMFVGEAPGASEDYQRQPFVERNDGSSAGSLLTECCREVGIDRRQVYITNVIKYRPPDNSLRRLGEIVDVNGNPVTIEGQINQLWEEIDAIKPNCIVSMGNLALKAVFGKGNGYKGVMSYRGSCMPTAHLNYKGVATIHPAALLHADGELADEDKVYGKKKGPLKYSYKHIFKLDLLKAKRQSESRLYEPPSRILEIARDHVQLQRFLDLYKDKDTVSVDIEVTRSIPFCIALAFNSWHAMSIPLLDVFSWQNEEGIPDHVAVEMWRMVAGVLESGIKVIGQNYKFDRRQLARLCGLYTKNFHVDTSLLAHALHAEFPKALEFLTSIYTDEPFYKDEGREFNWKKDKISRYLTYNARDAAVQFECYEAMMADAHEMKVPGFPNWVEEFIMGVQMPLHQFYYDLEDVGFLTDLPRQKELLIKYDGMIVQYENELQALAGWPVNCNSKKDCAILVYNQLKFPYRKGTAEDVLYGLIGNHTGKRPFAHKRMLELLLYIRRLKLNRKKSFAAKCDYDGRMRTVYTPTGTETGRSSTKILQPPVRPEKIGMPFQTMTKHGDVGTEVREMFPADEGYVIVETDMSQAEARIVALLGNDQRLLALFNSKADVHKLTASWIFGLPVDQINKELRFIGKTCRHAGNYDMGKHRFMELVNTDAKKAKIDISISEYKAGILLKKFHDYSPNIRNVFHAGIQKYLADNNRILVNPFGRYRQFYDRWNVSLWKEAYAQIPQSTVPDQIRLAGRRAKERFISNGIDARFVVEAHDALVGLVKKEHAEAYKAIIHEEIEKPIDFSRCSLSRGLLSIPAESKIGLTYKECETKGCSDPGCRFLHDYKTKKAA